MLLHFPGTDPRLARCEGIRRRVFIEEQGVAEAEELDGRDPGCEHVLLVIDGRDVATARLRLVDDGRVAKVERVAVEAADRGAGHGATVMRGLHARAAALGARELRLGAQLTALGFYTRLGYTAFGPVFDDAGIDHRMMRRAVPGLAAPVAAADSLGTTAPHGTAAPGAPPAPPDPS